MVFFCLNHSSCGALLQQPSQANIDGRKYEGYENPVGCHYYGFEVAASSSESSVADILADSEQGHTVVLFQLLHYKHEHLPHYYLLP